MLGWMEQNSGLIQAGVSAVTAVVWVVYLHLILSGLRRQRRTDILINLGGGIGGDARCLVSNLGLEPVYLLEVIVRMRRHDVTVTAPISERAELSDRRLSRPAEATNQGPIKSGEFIDIGSVADVVERAKQHLGETIRLADLDEVELPVVAQTASNSRLVAATREYQVGGPDSSDTLVPKNLHARQIRSPWGRRRLQRELQSLVAQRYRSASSTAEETGAAG